MHIHMYISTYIYMHRHMLSVVWRKNDGTGPPVAISATRRSFGGALFSRNMLTAHNQSPWPHFPRLDVEQVGTALVANCRPRTSWTSNQCGAFFSYST